MSTMDLKGIAWVGNIYNKFEAMCLEVEETMYQDTAKYVENQVQTVGASVKRFYSDVMQDLLPPSCMDPEKVGDTNLSLNASADIEIHKKSKSFMKKDPLIVDNLLTEDCKKNSDNLSDVQEKLCSEKIKARETYRRSNVGIKRISKRDNYSVSDKSSSKNPKSDNRKVVCDEITVQSLQPSVENIICGSSEEHENITETNTSVDDDKIESSVSDVNLSEESNGEKEARLRDVNSNEMCTSSVLVSHSDTHNDHSGDEEVFISHADLIDDNDAAEARVDDKPKLEETCVLVDGDILGFTSQTDTKSRSYKKKFRKAFSLKMGSGRKQEYEQLTARYGDAATPTLSTDSQPLNSSSCESEWELL